MSVCQTLFILFAKKIWLYYITHLHIGKKDGSLQAKKTSFLESILLLLQLRYLT